jgi:protein TonB
VFEQTFVNGPHQSRKPAAVALSLTAQAAAVAILAGLPLIYTQTLPLVRFRDLILARSPSQPAAPRTMVRVEAKPAVRAFVVPRLTTVAPSPVSSRQIENVPAAPEIGPTVAIPAESGPGINSLVAEMPQPAPAPPGQRKSNSGPVRVGGNVAAANLVHRVQPAYPQLAKAARVQGAVEFTAIISKEGNIGNLTLVRGHPLLVAAAREAVLQWKYRPTLLNGQPVEVVTDITVNFTLSH